jgi:DNA mismatch repair ATPase MutL
LVNGRLVKQPKLTQICIKAYQSEQFQKRFPEIFIDIHVPNDQVDIMCIQEKEVLFCIKKN